MARQAERETVYIDTGRGLFTASGIWFLTTEPMLRSYAGPVLEREPLAVLVRRAEHWLRSPETLALWLLPFVLTALPWAPAVLSTLTVYLAWKSLSPSFASRAGARLFAFLEKVPIQGLYYVLVLSVLAALGRYGAVWVGLAGFMLLRWGIVERLARFVVRPIWSSLYQLPVPDQVLRGFVIRAALHHGLSVPGLEEMERTLRERWFEKK